MKQEAIGNRFARKKIFAIQRARNYASTELLESIRGNAAHLHQNSIKNHWKPIAPDSHYSAAILRLENNFVRVPVVV